CALVQLVFASPFADIPHIYLSRSVIDLARTIISIRSNRPVPSQIPGLKEPIIFLCRPDNTIRMPQRRIGGRDTQPDADPSGLSIRTCSGTPELYFPDTFTDIVFISGIVDKDLFIIRV